MLSSSDFVVDNLKEVISNHNLFDGNQMVDLIVDGGSENKGKVDDLLAMPEFCYYSFPVFLTRLINNQM